MGSCFSLSNWYQGALISRFMCQYGLDTTHLPSMNACACLNGLIHCHLHCYCDNSLVNLVKLWTCMCKDLWLSYYLSSKCYICKILSLLNYLAMDTLNSYGDWILSSIKVWVFTGYSITIIWGCLTSLTYVRFSSFLLLAILTTILSLYMTCRYYTSFPSHTQHHENRL